MPSSLSTLRGAPCTALQGARRPQRVVVRPSARLLPAGRSLALSSRDVSFYTHRRGASTPGSPLGSVDATGTAGKANVLGVHHVALICRNLENSLEFYQGVLGLQINPDRPHDKLPYRGAWLWIGPEMIHLMELPNPDPTSGRPEHGGRDRHFCIGVENLEAMAAKLDAADIAFTRSMSGRPAIFFRDPDANCLEVVEIEPWR